MSYCILHYPIGLCFKCSFIRILRLIIRLSFNFFFHLIIPASGFRVLKNCALFGDNFWFLLICSFISHCFCVQTVACKIYWLSGNKMHINFSLNRSPVYPGLFFWIWLTRWMLLLLINCKKAGPLFGYD